MNARSMFRISMRQRLVVTGARNGIVSPKPLIKAWTTTRGLSTSPQEEKDHKDDSDGKKSSQSFGKSVLSTSAILFCGALAGMSWASFNLCKNPPEFLFPHTSTLPLSSTIASPIYNDTSKIVGSLEEFLREDQIVKSIDELSNHSDSFFSTDHPSPEERPDIVLYPETTEQVSRIMKIAHDNKVPVVPYTGGTSLEGHYFATRKGICIDMSRMNKVLQLNATDLDCVVQAGVSWEDLRDYLMPFKLLFGPDPGPGACIGGMCGTSCSGTNAARYGTMRENVVSLTVVLADGTIVKTKRRPRKSSAGYNLTNLIVGSEGTLGIVTEITVKLHVMPKYENVIVVSFPKLSDASEAVARVVQSGLHFNAMELLDATMMKFVNESGNVTKKYDELPTLMFKIGGNSTKMVNLITSDLKEICSDCDRKSFQFASDEEEKEELWTARKVALWSTIDAGKKVYGEDTQVWTTDVAVPISKLVEALVETRADLDNENIMASIVSHAGDGNYHALIVYPKEDYKRVSNVVQRMVSRAIKLDGTVTGEHGIGIGKREFLKEELDQSAIDLMRKIKFALDPLLILNPDKIIQIDPNEKIE